MIRCLHCNAETSNGLALCNLARPGHDRLNANTPPGEDHPWETMRGDRLPADQARTVVAELRDHKAVDLPFCGSCGIRHEPPLHYDAASTAGTDRVAPVRAALAAERDDAEESA